ncbi:hypothetical protein D3C76_912590 [compost metagenome]
MRRRLPPVVFADAIAGCNFGRDQGLPGIRHQLRVTEQRMYHPPIELRCLRLGQERLVLLAMLLASNTRTFGQLRAEPE